MTLSKAIGVKQLFEWAFRSILTVALVAIAVMVIGILPATAGASDDNFEGNIFSLYAGNGSLVPPRVDLAQSLGRDRPSLLVFYLEDSRDCKQFVTTISQLQASYGKVASFIPINTDSLAAEPTDDPTDVRFYFNGRVPQTVLVAGDGEVTFDGVGQVRYEAIDNAFREVFDLLPREESVELKRRVLNEFNVELTR